MLLGIGLDLFRRQFFQLGFALERALEILGFRLERLLLLADLHLLELREVAQAGIEDLFGLLIRELEALHQDGLGLVLAADDPDHLIEVQVGDHQAFEYVQPLGDLVEAMLQTARDRRDAELEPIREDAL